MDLATLWFVLVAVLWIGYLVLEGFDFGVGLLTRGFARDDAERRVLLTTIGPVWDGNEVWLISAVGATFAAFPEWYATAWSAYYLPIVVVLIALIGRGLALEYRAKGDTGRWRRRWDAVLVAGSLIPAIAWGVLLAGFARGLPLDAGHDFVGGIGDIFTPYALLGGAVTLALSLVHGAHYVALKTTGDLHERAGRLALGLTGPATVLVAGFLTWTVIAYADGGPSRWSTTLAAAAAVTAMGAGVIANRRSRDGWAFTATFVAIAAVGAALFASLFPDVLPSTLAGQAGLSADVASASSYTLAVMTWVALPAVPLVLGYQAWVYWTFRRRIGVPYSS